MSRVLPSLFAFGFAALTLLPGCLGDDAQDCTTEARSSVSLTVVDEQGNALADADAVFAVDGGAERDCESMGNGAFVCGWEEAGAFTITVDAEGFGAKTVQLTVDADECHVQTEILEVTLEPVACTDEAVPSVLVRVTDGQGEDVTSGDVVWNVAEEDDLPEPCTNIGGNEWYCAEEVAGNIRVEISNAGPYQPFSEVVTVEADECHVITETLDAVLEYLPD